jgi:hypothetical protein
MTAIVSVVVSIEQSWKYKSIVSCKDAFGGKHWNGRQCIGEK